MTHGSLFSGIGGFDLAAEWMGWQNEFHCEINPFGQKILKHYWPKAISYADIKTTDFTIHRGAIDVLSGGFPCQPFSTAGKRKGAEDDRYLWPEMLRAINEIRPTWIIGENVAGLTSMVQPEVEETILESQTNIEGQIDTEIIQEHQQYVVETVCSDLEKSGYSVHPIIIPASAVGAPHRRDRIWFIAYNTNTGIESMQRSGENGIYGFGVASDTNYKECNRWCSESKFEWQKTKLRRHRVLSTASRSCVQWPFAYTPSNRWERIGQAITNENRKEKPGTTGKLARRFKRLCSHGDAAHSYGVRLRRESDRSGKSEIVSKGSPGNYWQNFPTQSPVCGRNDGISSRLDGITFPKWRNESIKAFGNAVVPQVVYEIFKSIDL